MASPRTHISGSIFARRKSIALLLIWWWPWECTPARLQCGHHTGGGGLATCPHFPVGAGPDLDHHWCQRPATRSVSVSWGVASLGSSTCSRRTTRDPGPRSKSVCAITLTIFLPLRPSLLASYITLNSCDGIRGEITNLVCSSPISLCPVGPTPSSHTGAGHWVATRVLSGTQA